MRIRVVRARAFVVCVCVCVCGGGGGGVVIVLMFWCVRVCVFWACVRVEIMDNKMTGSGS